MGYTPKEILIWKPKEFFKLIHHDNRERVMEISDKMYFGKNEHLGDLQFKVIKKKGNLIDASRIESGKLELNINVNDLVKITKERVEEMSYLLNSRKLIVKLNFPDMMEFNIDKIRL